MFRPKLLRNGRSFRKRNDSEDESITMDWTKEPKSNLEEILMHIISKENVSKGQKLTYLNFFTKFCRLVEDIQETTLNCTIDEIFCCLRVTLLNESVEIRAAGLRAIRYLLKTNESIESLYRLNIHYLICRSIDIVLDNKSERIQAFRLIRKLLSLNANKFHPSLVRCLISICKNGTNDRDLLLRASLASLAELIMLNTKLAVETGAIAAILDAILLPQQAHNITEVLTGSILFLLNEPKYRHYLRDQQQLQHLVSPFTDFYYQPNLNTATTATAMQMKNVNTNNLNFEQFNYEQLNELNELKYTAAKNALLSVFRSWPGLIYLSRLNSFDVNLSYSSNTNANITSLASQKNESEMNTLRSLIEMLHLPYPETRRYLMELIFELFYLPIPVYDDDFSTALSSSLIYSNQDTWQLYDNFVVNEAFSLLPHLSKFRQNLTENYLALLLYAFISNGIIDGLTSIILAAKNVRNSIRAQILLGEILYLINKYLPPDLSQRCHSLPRLLDAATNFSLTPGERNIAAAAISNLSRFHSCKRLRNRRVSLYLQHLLDICNSTHLLLPTYSSSSATSSLSLNSSSQSPLPCSLSFFQSSSNSGKSTPSTITDVAATPLTSAATAIRKLSYQSRFHRGYQLRKEIGNEQVLSAVRDSQVLIRDFLNWNWDLIDCILKLPSENMRKLDDNTYKSFIKKLITFYKPSCQQFSKISIKHENERQICLVGLHLIDFLLDLDEQKANEYLNDLLIDLKLCLHQITVEQISSTEILSPTCILNNLSHYYFLFIGKLSSSNKGRKLLEKYDINQYLLDLISLSTHEVYLKLITSSLDYTNEGSFTRTLFIKILTSNFDSVRLYATNYLRVLLRARLSGFRKWALELLTQQLSDKSESVVLTAADIIDEAIDYEKNLDTLIYLRPSLLHIGDKGLLILIRFVSTVNGFKFLSENNFLSYEIERWRTSFYLKYVKLVENLLNETWTYHRTEDGTYGRRTDKKNLKKDAFLPPHLYGQLAKISDGIDLLLKEQLLEPMYEIIRAMDLSCSLSVLKLKGALWAVGHVAATALGFQVICDSHILPIIIEITADCPILSVRGVCFYILGLVASTDIGADFLKEFGWEAVRHCHNEQWPLVKDNQAKVKFVEDCPLWKHGHTLSSSSGASHAIELCFIKEHKSLKPVDSFIYNESQSNSFDGDNDKLYSSLSAIEGKKIFQSIKESIDDENESDIQQPHKSSKSLTRVSSLSPQHHQYLRNSISKRPRSSSDCRQRANSDSSEVGADVEDSDSSSGIWLKEQSTESVQHSVESSDIETLSISKVDQNADNELEKSGSSDFSQRVTLKNVDKNFIPMVNPKINRQMKIINSMGVSGAPRRKISDPVGFVIYKNISPSKIDDIASKSRTESLGESTSGVSSSDSLMFPNFGYPLQHQNLKKLSPIASLSSVTNNLSMLNFGNVNHNAYCTFPRKSSIPAIGSFNITDSSDVLANFESIPSALDASGYATLRAIQRNRSKLLGINLKNDLAHESFFKNDSSIDESVFNRRNSKSSSQKDFDEISSTASPASFDDQDSIDCSLITQLFMGLALPISLELLFFVPSTKEARTSSITSTMNFSKDYKTHLDKLSTEQLLNNNGFDLHSEQNCLQCRKIFPSFLKSEKSTLPSTSISENEAEEADLLPLNETASSKRRLTIPTESDATASSFTSCSSNEIGSSNIVDDRTGKILVLREILHYVINLSGSVAAKSSEQGLLNLKQKYSQAFQDVCLYSEISQYLASYNFRLQSRRFLQELFLDLNFDQLFNDAEIIVQNITRRENLTVKRKDSI